MQIILVDYVLLNVLSILTLMVITQRKDAFLLALHPLIYIRTLFLNNVFYGALMILMHKTTQEDACLNAQ